MNKKKFLEIQIFMHALQKRRVNKDVLELKIRPQAGKQRDKKQTCIGLIAIFIWNFAALAKSARRGKGQLVESQSMAIG